MARWIVFVALEVAVAIFNVQQSNAQSLAARPSFEVVSIKPDSPLSQYFPEVRLLPGGRLSVEKTVLRSLIENAYGLKSYQISGGPNWINSEGYDIEARADGPASAPQMRLMMQTLLEDRFKLKAHSEIREIPVYELAVTKSGIKMQQPKEGSCAPRDASAALSPPGPGHLALAPCGRVTSMFIDSSTPMVRIQGGNVSMQELTRVFSNFLDRIIIDKTGFTGTFDVHLDFAWDDALAGLPHFKGPLPADPAPSVFSAVQQLGLRLESAKGPVEVLVIEHVERPSAN